MERNNPYRDPADKRMVELVRDERDLDREVFDRIAYAAYALRLLGKKGRLTVAICPGASKVRVEEGNDRRKGPGARWAILSIPPDASRATIAAAIVRLARREQDPYAFELVMRARLP